MNDDQDKFLFNRGQLAKLMSTTGPTIDRWSITPVETRGKATLYDARIVIQYRLNRDKEQEGVLDLSKEKARLAKEQADAKALDNAEKRGELIPRQAVLDQWQTDYSALRSQLLALPTKMAQANMDLLPAEELHKLESQARELIYECLGELSGTGLPGSDDEAIAGSEDDVETAPKANSKPVADAHRKLSPEASAEQGQWKTSRAEYQREIMDAYNDPLVHEIWFMKSSQVGWTEILNNIVGYIIDHIPGPVLLIQPTLEMAEAWSTDRLAPMLRDTKRLWGKIKDARSRDSGNKMKHKTFPGGHITMAGANSPASLASRPIRDLLCDEVSRYPASAGTEGDPIGISKKRTTTYYNAKVICGSSPGLAGFCRVEKGFEGSDKRRYHVACPECNHEHTLSWQNVQWDKEVCDEGRKAKHLPNTAYMVCPECGSVIKEAQKSKMIREGHWIATAPFHGIAGFHINELYSPWKRWGEVVEDFLKSKDDPELLKVWTNTSLGETFRVEGDAVDNALLYDRREKYSAQLPEGVLLLTCFADVQEDRLELEVMGWGRGEESWGIEYRVLYGDTTQPEVWEELTQVIGQSYRHANGAQLAISATGIDSGFRAQMVYNYVKLRKAQRVFACKGVGGDGRPLLSAPAHKQSGKDKRKVDLFTIGTNEAKGILLARLTQDVPGPGYSHFPIEYDAEYFAQLTAEERQTKYYKGFPRSEWVKTRPRNEALDIRVGNMAILKLVNPVWDALETYLAAASTAAANNEAVTVGRPQRRVRSRGAG